MRGLLETLPGFGSDLSTTEDTGASLAVALGLELRTDSVCFSGSICCSSLCESKGFLVHAQAGLIWQGRAMDMRPHMPAPHAHVQ